MENGTFVIERIYNAPVEKVWRALTELEQIRQWYFDIAEFEPVVGFTFTFMGGSKEMQYKHICTITAAEPLSKLAYSWQYDGYEGNSEVSFELFEEGDGTRLKLTHTGLDTFPPLKDFQRESFAKGWTYITDTPLRNFVENA